MSHFQAPQTHHQQLCFHIDNIFHRTTTPAWAVEYFKINLQVFTIVIC